MDARFRKLVQEAANDLAATENRQRYPTLAALGSRLLIVIQPKDQGIEHAITSNGETAVECPCYPLDELITFINRLPSPHDRIVAAMVAFYDLGQLTHEIDIVAAHHGDQF